MIENKTKREGKSLIFTDLHVGISNDKPSRQKIAESFIDEIIGRIETEDIRQVFFLGDLFHQRTSIEVTSLNVANDLVRKLASSCEVFLLQGNHDLYEKYNSVITSLNIFDIDNVNLISVPTEIVLNGQSIWRGEAFDARRFTPIEIEIPVYTLVRNGNRLVIRNVSPAEEKSRKPMVHYVVVRK